MAKENNLFEKIQKSNNRKEIMEFLKDMTWIDYTKNSNIISFVYSFEYNNDLYSIKGSFPSNTLKNSILEIDQPYCVINKI
jgi:hypothetical protein